MKTSKIIILFLFILCCCSIKYATVLYTCNDYYCNRNNLYLDFDNVEIYLNGLSKNEFNTRYDMFYNFQKEYLTTEKYIKIRNNYYKKYKEYARNNTLAISLPINIEGTYSKAFLGKKIYSKYPRSLDSYFGFVFSIPEFLLDDFIDNVEIYLEVDKKLFKGAIDHKYKELVKFPIQIRNFVDGILIIKYKNIQKEIYLERKIIYNSNAN